MKRSLLQRLYSGELYPADEIEPKSSEYQALMRAIGEEKRYFHSVLRGDDRRHFDRLEELLGHSSHLYACENFIYGFRLGAQMLLETAQESLAPQ